MSSKYSLSNLTFSERDIIKQCLKAVVEGPFFPEWEFQSLFGIERNEVKDILDSWLTVDTSQKKNQIVINNCFVNLLNYPKINKKDWIKFFSISSKELEKIFKKWQTN